MLAECSTAEVMTCRLVGWHKIALWMAALLLSVPQLVKTMWRGSAPMSAATCSRAVSIMRAGALARPYALDGLPQCSVRHGNIASTTSGATRVVALLSR